MHMLEQMGRIEQQHFCCHHNTGCTISHQTPCMQSAGTALGCTSHELPARQPLLKHAKAGGLGRFEQQRVCWPPSYGVRTCVTNIMHAGINAAAPHMEGQWGYYCLKVQRLEQLQRLVAEATPPATPLGQMISADMPSGENMPLQRGGLHATRRLRSMSKQLQCRLPCNPKGLQSLAIVTYLSPP